MSNIRQSDVKAMIIDNKHDFICIVYDEIGNIVYPENPTILKKYRKIIECPTSISGIYCVEETSEWYEKYENADQIEGKKYKLEYYRNITKFKNLEHHLQKDHTTGIANRKYAIERINEYIKYAIDHNEEFTVMMADVNNFKTINDTYGHFFGDIVLKNIGDLIINNVRHRDTSSDIAGRFGGDEFFGLIKGISFDDSKKWVERADEMVRTLVHTSSDRKTSVTDISMSIGMYHVSTDDLKEFSYRSLSIEEIRKMIFERCDKVLYEVKNAYHASQSQNKIMLMH